MDVAATMTVRADREYADAGPDTAAGRSGATDGRTGLDAELYEIFQRMAAAPAGSAERDRLRTQVIERALPVVNRLARRFRGRGEQLEDLAQAGALALLKAVDSYDPRRRVPFTGYLVPCVVGALKRHFRDEGWDVRVPRPLQERHLRIESAGADLTQRLGRAPTRAELAAELGLSADEVMAGLAARHAYDTSSLNEPAAPDSGGDERQDLLGGPDPDLEEVADHVSLDPLLQRLPERERLIVTRRYYGNRTQSQIAAELGISQMHVSRILDRVLAWLRRALLDDGPARYPGTEDDRPLGISTYPVGSTVLVTVRGAVDARAAAYLRSALVDAVMAHRPRYLILDLHGVPEMVTAGVAAFVAARSACGHVGARLRIARVSRPVAGTLERAGLGWLVADHRPRPAAATASVIPPRPATASVVPPRPATAAAEVPSRPAPAVAPSRPAPASVVPPRPANPPCRPRPSAHRAPRHLAAAARGIPRAPAHPYRSARTRCPLWPTSRRRRRRLPPGRAGPESDTRAGVRWSETGMPRSKPCTPAQPRRWAQWLTFPVSPIWPRIPTSRRCASATNGSARAARP